MAHGDILFNDRRAFPFAQELGLRDYGGRGATDWRKIVAAGKTHEPSVTGKKTWPVPQPSIRFG